MFYSNSLVFAYFFSNTLVFGYKLLSHKMGISFDFIYFRKLCSRVDPVYQAIRSENIDFDEVLISPTMVQDHMPDKVMEALEKVRG